MADARERLVRFLEQHAFQPVLSARDDRFPEGQRDTLHDLQRRTRTEVERFRHYGSAHEVVVNFHRDLSSGPAKKVHQELKRLGLPTIVDVREAFDSLAGELGVG